MTSLAYYSWIFSAAQAPAAVEVLALLGAAHHLGSTPRVSTDQVVKPTGTGWRRNGRRNCDRSRRTKKDPASPPNLKRQGCISGNSGQVISNHFRFIFGPFFFQAPTSAPVTMKEINIFGAQDTSSSTVGRIPKLKVKNARVRCYLLDYSFF